MKNIVWFILLSLILSAPLGAQVVTVGPVTLGMKFAWNAPVNIPQSELATFEVRARDSKTGTAFAVLASITCSGSPVIACIAPLTQANVDAFNMIGAHNLTLTYYRLDTGEGVTSVPFLLTSVSLAPTTVRIIQ